jgi:hypothetical protein
MIGVRRLMRLMKKVSHGERSHVPARNKALKKKTLTCRLNPSRMCWRKMDFVWS